MKKSNAAKVRELAAKIEPLMCAVSNQLSDMVFRAGISDILRRLGYDELLEILLADRHALPGRLVKGYVVALPSLLSLGFGELEEVSKPLKEIAALLHRDALRGWVKIRDETGCRIKDNRMLLEDFKTELCKQLFPKAEGARKN